MSRSSRWTSSCTIASNCARNSGSLTAPSPSTADRNEASGFFSSCVTSAANASIASIRLRSALVMSDSARASIPISSRRLGRRGTTTSRARPSRTRIAARASIRIGRTMVRARNSDSSTDSRNATASTRLSRARSVRTVEVMSRALTVAISTRSSGSGAAAVTTGVRSGARHTVAAVAPVVRTVTTSGQRRPRPGARSRYNGSRSLPTTVSIPASSARAASCCQPSLSGSTSWKLRTPSARLSATSRPRRS